VRWVLALVSPLGRGARLVVGVQLAVLAVIALVALGSRALAVPADPGASAAGGEQAAGRGAFAAELAAPRARALAVPASVTPAARDRVAAWLGSEAAIPAVSRGLRYPIVGPSRLTESFGDPRGGGRSHAGVDIMAGKLLPVLAVADGTVSWVRAGMPGAGVMVSVRHDDGWTSRYMHLNNDLPGSDDGDGHGVAEGVVEGARVRAGDVLGWVGDSGNAESTSPHLHFELRDPDGAPVDPYPLLSAALAVVQGEGELAVAASG
jgi:murein DD-endopeptidase MepM/ murein hydrolase activator NlpD